MIVPQATYKWDGRVECQFPFSKPLIDAFKTHIPASHREYVPDSKAWVFNPIYASQALQLMRDVFGDVTVVDQRFYHRDTPPPPTSKPQFDPDFATLYVLPTAPRCVVDAAFRALAREYHPDRLPADDRDSGHERMVKINTAYERVRDRVAS